MAANIGGIACDFVKGPLQDMQELSERWKVRGLDGPGIQNHGKGGGDFKLVAVKFGTYAAVQSWAASIQDLQGDPDLTAVENDEGDTATNTYIQTVSPCRISPAVIPGTSTTTRGELDVLGYPTE